MSLRVVVLGTGGRLGAALLRQWRISGLDVVGFNRAQLDLSRAADIRAVLEPLEFDVLVNCAAVTQVDWAEAHPDEAFWVNRDAPGELARICAQKQRRCIHVSTDYVFDGEKEGPYSEEDPTAPLSVYGRSKQEGEAAVLQASERHWVVRVSWVFGPDRPSFLESLLQRALEGETVAAIADKVSTPTFTHDAADWLLPFLDKIDGGGLLHLCGAGACTWKEYGQCAVDAALAAGVPLKARTVAPLLLADMKGFVAKRPPRTAMATQKLARLTGLQPRPWQEAVEEYVREFWAPRVRGEG